MKKPLVLILGLLAAAFVAIQFRPVTRDNPPVTAGIEAPADVLTVLRQSCYDCHSNETRWPWYSRVAPVSWIVADDVSEARRNLNFSVWESYPEMHRKELRLEILEEIEAGKMPLPKYLRLHRDAVLTQDDVIVLEEWFGGGS